MIFFIKTKIICFFFIFFTLKINLESYIYKTGTWLMWSGSPWFVFLNYTNYIFLFSLWFPTGRRFRFGKVENEKVIIVMTGLSMVWHNDGPIFLFHTCLIHLGLCRNLSYFLICVAECRYRHTVTVNSI
jgi:hypothetical protein